MSTVRDVIAHEPALVRAAAVFVLVVVARVVLDLDEEVIYTSLAALGLSAVSTRQAVTPAPPPVTDSDPHTGE